MAQKKKLGYRQRLSAIFASFAILVVGTISLLETMSLDYYSVLGTLEKVIPASLILGTLGWSMGMVLDKPRTRPKGGYTNYFVQEMMKKDLASMEDGVAAAEGEKNEEQD